LFKGNWELIKKKLKALLKNRLLVLGLLMGVLLFIVIIRLFQLQIVRGQDYYDDYVSTTKKEVSISAIRGNIYDRNGVLLAGNKAVYNVTLTDWNYYTKSDGQFNEMLLKLVNLLEKYGITMRKLLPVTVDETDHFVYDGTETKIRQLIRDVYGKSTIAELAEEGIDAYSYDADTVMAKLKSIYNFTSKWAGAADVSNADALKICNMRYLVAQTSYTRYISTVIATDVSEEVQAAVLESQKELMGVNVEESYVRVYYDSEVFSGILGYVGSITQEEIEELNAQGGNYIAGDIIGKEGIESAYESYLQGEKGTKIIYVNNTGMILSEEITEEPKRGQDIYLSIDHDTMVAAYNVIEQQLSGVIVKHLYAGTDYDPVAASQKSEYLLPIRDVYFQMINNNILSFRDFGLDSASKTEKEMDRKMKARKEEVTRILSNYLKKRYSTPLSSETEYIQAYIQYLYSYMTSKNYLQKSLIDTTDATYKAWRAGEISFPDILFHALEEGWVDTSVLGENERYNTVSDCYEAFVELLIKHLSVQYGDFDKLVYDELIHRDIITGCEVGIALFEQGVLKPDQTAYEKLNYGDADTAFSFFEAKIISMELTPAQIALDPCSAGLVLTDPNTGELLAVVSYPGYDANRINDSTYYNSLLNDLSSPLYSRATQSKLAPGSTFKMITTTAAIEGGYYSPDDLITCDGIFPYLDHPRCWIYRLQGGTHGDLDFVHALGQSCNCFFYSCGYKMSLNAKGVYNPTIGINVLNQYAALYGFGTATGIEVEENVSSLTTELPVTSAIGQGTFAFTTISVARYVTALASEGNLYEFKLLNHIEDSSGETVLPYTPVIKNHIELQQATWDRIHEGMYTVIHEGGSRSGDFVGLRYDYAAKSGSAQENKLRPEHGWYVSYGPYKNPNYAMAVQIPNGYSAGNAALVSEALYQFLEGNISLEEILENSASTGEIIDNPD